jgi:hypothetical protein
MAPEGVRCPLILPTLLNKYIFMREPWARVLLCWNTMIVYVLNLQIVQQL